MRYFISFSTLFLLPTIFFAQNSEELIPRDAVTVFSINNTSLLKKIPMDDLVQYEFMEEVQSELFNGSTTGKTIKDAGFDFDQRINAFFGQSQEYDVSGFTFGVSDASGILKVFDNFDEINSHIPGVKIYRNQLNYLFIRGTSALVIRVEPDTKLVKKVADSIWLESGYGYYIPDDDWNFNGISDEGYEFEGDGDNITEESDFEIEANDSTLLLSDEIDDMDLLNKNYWELRDSVLYEYQQLFIRKISTEIFVENSSLYSDYEDFRNQLSKSVDGVFYLDNSRNLTSNKGIWQFQNVFPSLFNDAQRLYNNNVLTGELNIVKNEIIMDIHAKYDDALGKIYTDISKTKFNKNFQKYIHKDALAYLSYNVDLKRAYHTSFDIIMDLVEHDTDQKVVSNILMAEVINEFVDIDNIFEVYQGSMFASLNGYKRIKVTHIDYQYDEETFEYSETEVEEDQDIPNFTIGFKTNNHDFLARMARLLSRTQSDITPHGDYYEVNNAVLGTIPLYFAIVDDIVLLSVDENLFTTHLNGYAKSERINIKNAKKSKFTYVHLDLDNALKKLPREALSDRQNDIINTLINRSGVIDFRTVKIDKKEAQFQINYTFNEDIENNGKYLLDLVNSLYTFIKK